MNKKKKEQEKKTNIIIFIADFLENAKSHHKKGSLTNDFLPGIMFFRGGIWVFDESLVCGILIPLIRDETREKEEGILRRGKDIFTN